MVKPGRGARPAGFVTLLPRELCGPRLLSEGFSRRGWNYLDKVKAIQLTGLRSLMRGVSREEGQALIEYALIVSLIALVAIVASGRPARTSR
jgi:hypothetical protein